MNSTLLVAAEEEADPPPGLSPPPDARAGDDDAPVGLESLSILNRASSSMILVLRVLAFLHLLCPPEKPVINQHPRTARERERESDSE